MHKVHVHWWVADSADGWSAWWQTHAAEEVRWDDQRHDQDGCQHEAQDEHLSEVEADVVIAVVVRADVTRGAAVTRAVDTHDNVAISDLRCKMNAIIKQSENYWKYSTKET